MAESRYTYSVLDHDADSRFPVPAHQLVLRDATIVPGAIDRDWAYMAEACAKDYFNNHDGWEASWPLKFRLYEDGAAVANVSVEMEAEPTFFASGEAP